MIWYIYDMKFLKSKTLNIYLKKQPKIKRCTYIVYILSKEFSILSYEFSISFTPLISRILIIFIIIFASDLFHVKHRILNKDKFLVVFIEMIFVVPKIFTFDLFALSPHK